MTPWEIKAVEFGACNCAYGCPCQFNALPTNGNCQAIVGFRFDEGHFGETRLDGLKACAVLSWPGPIHEGRGSALLIIDDGASEEQRQALLTIMSGQETDPGATMWNVFASTLENVHDPVFKPVRLDVDVEARTGRMVVDNMVDSQGSPILNPVTGQEHRARIDLPHGFEYTIAEMGSSTSRASGPIELSWENRYGQFARLHLNNHGIVRAAAA